MTTLEQQINDAALILKKNRKQFEEAYKKRMELMGVLINLIEQIPPDAECFETSKESFDYLTNDLKQESSEAKKVLEKRKPKTFGLRIDEV